MFKLRIYCRYKGFITSFTGNSVADCERKAREAGYEERGSHYFLR